MSVEDANAVALVLGLAVALGLFWLFTAVALGWRGFGFSPTPARATRRPRRSIDAWLRRVGLEHVDQREFGAVVLMLFVLGAALAYVAFGGVFPAIAVGGFAASFPIASYRSRVEYRQRRAQEAWPRMIEEIRIQTGAMGRSIPHALFAVGRRGPEELRPSFEAGHREWLLTTDFPRTVATLKASLGDPSADMACETLLIAHELGGADLDRRLEALAEDRLRDVQGRKDARSRLAGARFARMFVLVVPAGMAAAGMSIGNGRAAYRSPTGQTIVMIALGFVIACWVWAGRIMRLPEHERVFR